VADVFLCITLDWVKKCKYVAIFIWKEFNEALNFLSNLLMYADGDNIILKLKKKNEERKNILL